MFCRTCGKPLEDELKFCPNCGEPVDGKTEVNSSEDPKTMIFAHKTHDYVSDFKKGFNCFINYITIILINPTKTLESADTHLSKKKTLAFTIVLAVLYSIIQCILLKLLYSGFVSMIDGITSQIPFESGNLFGSRIINEFYSQKLQWFRIFIINFMFIIIFVVILSLLSFVLYTLIMKKTGKIMDFVKLYLSSLVLLVVISFIVMISAAINLKLMIIISIIGAMLYITSITINFVNFLKNEAKVIYTLPVIIFLSLFLSYYIYIKIM